MNKVNYHHEKQRYSIRKYAFGAASVLIGCAYYGKRSSRTC